MWARVGGADDFAHIDTARNQRIGDERPVASPGNSFRAHQGDSLRRRQLKTLFEGILKLRRLHVVGIAAKARIAPSHVRRVLPRPTETAEPGHVRISDACALKRLGQLILPELRIVARLGDGADVNQPLYPVRGEQIKEFVDRTCRMPDGEDRHTGSLAFR